ncbi:MAG: hypothetical protein ACRDK5_07165, partial [Solirubrobacterales bacterium]
ESVEHLFGQIASPELEPSERALISERSRETAELLRQLKPNEHKALGLLAAGYRYQEIMEMTVDLHEGQSADRRGPRSPARTCGRGGRRARVMDPVTGGDYREHVAGGNRPLELAGDRALGRQSERMFA